MEPKIVVLGGGPSAESVVSKRSAEVVFQAFHDVNVNARLALLDGTQLPADLKPERDILFLTTHGTFGEDGQLQRILDERGFIYTGADAAASALCFDKWRTRQVAQKAGLNIALGRLCPAPGNLPQDICGKAEKIWNQLGPKMVMKPNTEGSSVGLHIIEKRMELVNLLGKLNGTAYLAERFVKGREFTVGVLGREAMRVGELTHTQSDWNSVIPHDRALAVVEIAPQGGVYDYARKYTPGATQYICPARIPPALVRMLQAQAVKIFRATGCRDFARVDFRYDEKSGQPIFLEINTLPGLTSTSLLPKSADAVGIDFPRLLRYMLRGARHRFEERALAIP